MAKKSCFDGEVYKGYKISLKLVREGLEEYEPYSIQSPMDVYRFMRDLEDSDRERYFPIYLDVKNDVVGCEEAFVGTCTVRWFTPGRSSSQPGCAQQRPSLRFTITRVVTRDPRQRTRA